MNPQPPRTSGGLGIGCPQRRVALELTATGCAVLYDLAVHAPEC